MRLMKAHVRWVPTNRMLADALTKDSGPPTDLLRACMRRSRYQISPEETVLEYQALERGRRVQKRNDASVPANSNSSKDYISNQRLKH